MISRSPVHRAEFFFVFREARRSTPMMAADRSTSSCCAILFLIVTFGLPSVAASATLEESAKELAQKIAAALPAQENVSCEIRNLSSLNTDETARVEQTLKTELLSRGISVSVSGSPTSVVVTLSENFKNLIWTAEIREGDTFRLVLIAPKRTFETRGVSSAMPVAIRSEKLWEGPNHILDALEIVNGIGKSRLVLLLSDGVMIQDRQTGSVDTIEIKSDHSASRDPGGSLKEVGPDFIALYRGLQSCTVNLESRTSLGCLPVEYATKSGLIIGHQPLMASAPPTPPLTGKGSLSVVMPVCGSEDRFLATGAGDDTQADSLQMFETAPSGAVAVSPELKFPGPITALHAGILGRDWPSAVVRNLTTGNYEAYHLSFSCGQ